jgi:hypothetical protein
MNDISKQTLKMENMEELNLRASLLKKALSDLL